MDNTEIVGFDLTGQALYPGDWVYYVSLRRRKAFARIIDRAPEQKYSQDNVTIGILVKCYNYYTKQYSCHIRTIPYYSGDVLKVDEDRVTIPYKQVLVNYKY